jgi:hypothetical protein
MLDKLRISVPLLLLAGILGTIGSPVASVAGIKGKRNTAIGLSAATLYELGRGHTGSALILGAGSAYAWKRTNDAKHNRHHRYYSHSRSTSYRR